MRTVPCCALQWNAIARFIGEALSQAIKFFPLMAGRVTDEQPIIAFRNRLIHGYATVRHALVWDVVQTELPKLKEEIAQMAREAAEHHS